MDSLLGPVLLLWGSVALMGQSPGTKLHGPVLQVSVISWRADILQGSVYGIRRSGTGQDSWALGHQHWHRFCLCRSTILLLPYQLPAPEAALYVFAEAAASDASMVQLCKWHIGEAVNWERLGSCLCWACRRRGVKEYGLCRCL